MEKTLLIIPCFNEEASIGKVIEELLPKLSDFKILIVNDCSKDATSEIARQTGDAIVIDLPVNLGVGGAVQTGFMYAIKHNFSFAVKFDGDGQHDPESIKELIQPLIDEKADIVIGSRFLQKNQGFKSTFWRRCGIKFFEFVCQILTGGRLTDPTSGLRAYNRKAINFMADHYPSFDYPEPEEIILASKNGLIMVELPVIMRERQAGISTISSALSIYYMLKVTLSMLFVYLREPETKGSQNNA
ncbi:MAG: glycosyltransferase family 2 protein [Candidatus Riflebacteria bacterium]|nr:glycosyltransferase family 2 protein [Candidatus Riflebacteria bacterium]